MASRAADPAALMENAECGDCGPPPDEPALEGEELKMSMGEFVLSIGALLLALPALIGACCWPMVLGAMLNLGASFMNGGGGSGMVDFFHGFQVAIMCTIMLNLTQFVYWTCWQKRSNLGSWWKVHQPTFLVLLAAILVNIQPMAILVIGSWKLCCAECSVLGIPASQCPTGFSFPPWNPTSGPRSCGAPGGNLFWDKSYCSGTKYPIFPTVWKGWAIQILCTWGGFFFMFIGVMQATQLHKKIGSKWKAIRRGRTVATGSSGIQAARQ